MNENRGAVEPFNLFGQRSLIYTKEQAARILRNNSYYVFVSAFILLGALFVLLFMKREIFVTRTTMLVFVIFYVFLGAAIRYFKSRVASILALVSFGYALISRIIQLDFGWLFFGNILFATASYRCVKASFFYHKAGQTKNEQSVKPVVPPDR